MQERRSYVHFRISRSDASDDFLFALVGQTVPQAEEVKVIQRRDGAARVGFVVYPTSVASIKEAYHGAAELQQGEYSPGIPFVSGAGIGQGFPGGYMHKGPLEDWASTRHLSCEEIIERFANRQSLLLQEAQEKIASLEAKEERLRAVMRKAAQDIWATRRIVKSGQLGRIRAELETAVAKAEEDSMIQS